MNDHNGVVQKNLPAYKDRVYSLGRKGLEIRSLNDPNFGIISNESDFIDVAVRDLMNYTGITSVRMGYLLASAYLDPTIFTELSMREHMDRVRFRRNPDDVLAEVIASEIRKRGSKKLGELHFPRLMGLRGHSGNFHLDSACVSLLNNAVTKIGDDGNMLKDKTPVIEDGYSRYDLFHVCFDDNKLDPASCGVFYFRINQTGFDHSHSEFEFYYIPRSSGKGTLDFEDAGRQVSLKGGQHTQFIGPNERHAVSSRGSRDLKAVVLKAPSDLIDHFNKNDRLSLQEVVEEE